MTVDGNLFEGTGISVEVRVKARAAKAKGVKDSVLQGALVEVERELVELRDAAMSARLVTAEEVFAKSKWASWNAGGTKVCTVGVRQCAEVTTVLTKREMKKLGWIK